MKHKYYDFGGATAYTPQDVCFLLRWHSTSWNGVWFYNTSRIQGWTGEITVTYPKGPFLPVDCVAGELPVVSPRLRQFLEREVPNAIQFLPIRLQEDGGPGVVTDYFYAHILISVDCIDREKTVVEGGKWRRNRDGCFEILFGETLRRDLIGDQRIFRVDGWPMVLAVRGDVKAAIEQQGFTGCAFSERRISG